MPSDKPRVEIVLTAHLTHVSGPVVEDPGHVLSYTVCDGQSYGEGYKGPTFEVCPNCPDPDECDCHETEQSVYRMDFTSAGWPRSGAEIEVAGYLRAVKALSDVDTRTLAARLCLREAETTTAGSLLRAIAAHLTSKISS